MGGYGPTVIYDEIAASDDMGNIDFIRGECEYAFNDVMPATKEEKDFRDVPNLTYRSGGSIYHNPAAPEVHVFFRVGIYLQDVYQ